MTEDEYEKLVVRIKSDISIYTDEEYEELVSRIKFDLYQEFINPDTASYGIKYVEGEPEVNNIDKILSDKDLLQDELSRLCLLQNKFIDDEQYEKAEIYKQKIQLIQNKIDKL